MRACTHTRQKGTKRDRHRDTERKKRGIRNERETERQREEIGGEEKRKNRKIQKEQRKRATVGMSRGGRVRSGPGDRGPERGVQGGGRRQERGLDWGPGWPSLLSEVLQPLAGVPLVGMLRAWSQVPRLPEGQEVSWCP